MKYTITNVRRYSKDKDGNPLKTKTGKPYERVNIQVQEHGDKWISGFGNSRNKNWQSGEEVEIDVKENGQYLNFDMPKPVLQGAMSNEDREMLVTIKTGVVMALDELRSIKAMLSVAKDPEEIEVDEMPF